MASLGKSDDYTHYDGGSGLRACMVITYSKGKDQSGKVANPARGQLNRGENDFLPCLRSRLKIWSRETVSAVLSRVSLLISIHAQAESGAYLRDSSRVPRRRPFIA